MLFSITSISGHARARAKTQRSLVSKFLARDWSIRFDAFVTMTIPYLAVIAIIIGAIVGIRLPPLVGPRTQFPTEILAIAWPVDVGLMVGALTLGMVRLQSQYEGPARPVVYRYGVNQARLTPVAWIGATGNSFLLILLADWLYRNDVSWTLVNMSLAATGVLIIVSVWAFIGTVQAMSPTNESKLTENALRELVELAIQRMVYVIAFRDVLKELMAPLSIVVPEVEIALDNNTFKSFGDGYVRQVWFWGLEAVKEELQLGTLSSHELATGIAALTIPVDRRLKRGQFLGTTNTRDLEGLRQHTVIWLTGSGNNRIEALRDEVMRLLRHVERNPDGDSGVLSALLTLQRLIIGVTKEAALDVSRWIPVFDAAFYRITQAVSGHKLEEDFLRDLMSNLNREPSDAQAAYAIKMLSAVPALQKSDLVIGALRDYLELLCPAQIREYPAWESVILQITNEALKSWLTFLKDSPPDASQDWTRILRLWQTDAFESYYSKLDAIRTRLVVQLFAYWVQEERRGHATCLKQVFQWVGPQIRLELFEASTLTASDPRVSEPFYEWERSVGEMPSLDLTKARLKENVGLVHNAVKICQHAPIDNGEIESFVRADGPLLFGLEVPIGA